MNGTPPNENDPPNAEPSGVPSPGNAPTVEGWVSVFESATDFEADLVRDRLDEQGIPAVVFTQRDHTFNLNLGNLAAVHVMVPPQHEAAGRAAVGETLASDEELEAAAMAADPAAPDAHGAGAEASLDSGMDSLNLQIPEQSGDLDARPGDSDAPHAQPRG